MWTIRKTDIFGNLYISFQSYTFHVDGHLFARQTTEKQCSLLTAHCSVLTAHSRCGLVQTPLKRAQQSERGNIISRKRTKMLTSACRESRGRQRREGRVEGERERERERRGEREREREFMKGEKRERNERDRESEKKGVQKKRRE